MLKSEFQGNSEQFATKPTNTEQIEIVNWLDKITNANKIQKDLAEKILVFIDKVNSNWDSKIRGPEKLWNTYALDAIIEHVNLKSNTDSEILTEGDIDVETLKSAINLLVVATEEIAEITSNTRNQCDQLMGECNMN